MELLALQTAYPREIVAAFEAQGFIWGGKWYHYDIMHFEYRPELLAKARLAVPGAKAFQIIPGRTVIIGELWPQRLCKGHG